MTREALLIFTKNAEKGRVKTRLAATIGIEEAFAINQKLVDHTFEITSNLPFDKFIFYSDYIPAEKSINSYRQKVQQGTNLGEKMSHAITSVFLMGFEKVVIIGTDCPEIDAEIISGAFANLDDNDVVIGPAADGGYYLIGMKRQIPELFAAIPWSTNAVLGETLSICERNDIIYWLLPTLHDVDEEKDLVYMQSLIN